MKAPFQRRRHWAHAGVIGMALTSLTYAPASVAQGITTSSVDATPRMDMRTAFFSALKSPSGTYKGELNGDFADYARKALKVSSGTKVYVDVKTVGVFEQPGCRRLHADITVPDLTWIDSAGKPQSFSYQYEMNLCPDGRPPMPPDGDTQASGGLDKSAPRASGQTVISRKGK